jgi:6-phosphogluconolactonase/glucosamine-6-phosphate isomerase/deaminase
MSLEIRTTKNIEEISDFIASSINIELGLGKNVLWFVSGGSSIPVEILVAGKINEKFTNKLVVTLADERFGPSNHSESNWLKLMNAGFKIKGAKMIPFLNDKNMRETTEEIREVISTELQNAEFKIGIFGIGIDGHTAGILPHTLAVSSKEIVCMYETDLHNRLTITPRTIEMLDEAVLFAIGENKWEAIEKLSNDIPIDDEPAQILKKVPLLTIFTDYKVKYESR